MIKCLLDSYLEFTCIMIVIGVEGSGWGITTKNITVYYYRFYLTVYTFETVIEVNALKAVQ